MDLITQSGSSFLAVVTGTLFFASYMFYKWLLPKPIKGVPYNTEATKSIFGDIPDMLEHLKHSKTITDWMEGQNLKHDSPIAQTFFNLFQKPVVIINDFKESQDILIRRSKEFDKPDMISDLLYGLAHEHHTLLKSSDARFKLQRKWLQDLMSPGFLHGVAGPHLHKTFMELIVLWQEKMRLSGPEQHPFPVKTDITHSALEAIWAAMFGTGETATITMKQYDMTSALQPGSVKILSDGALDIPMAELAPTFDAVIKLTDMFEGVTKSPFPRVYGKYLTYRYPGLIKVKDDLILDEVDQAVGRMHNINGDDGKVTNAIDHMVHRETQQAKRDNRKPMYHSKAMISEIFGLLVAGHDTTSTTLMWSMKWFSRYPEVQSRLRSDLRKAYSAAFTDGRVPTAKEIATEPIPYLDAFMEESVRFSQTAPIISRTTTTDAVVLGYVIPKGTLCVMLGRSGGILKPAHKIPDTLRSPAYHTAGGGKIGEWDETSPEEMAAFNPDRWLKTDANGSQIFDATLGPHLGFGAGPRSCFGRKMAYIELRLAIVLILWHFEMLKVPDHLDTTEAIEQLTHLPVQCYVRLAPAP
ncbi:cytochrome P450 [Boeremia exigua]|uniref:cytochrome P450 n=1 Tax=Boeremia exigua TaxID=749465 RepID=UPI001E8D5E6D|nr:cytochrome P450 [Boeremia exigua]KAH6637941.1 cytochrome P450 [Boeremia exigua]